MREYSRKLLALLTAAAALTAAVMPAGAAPAADAGVKPTYDEAYYATLDYYGNLTEGSVVKSYTLNGADTLVDYGTYDEVINLTDGSSPSSEGDRTEFHFGEGAPAHFYFEGKTAQPYRDLPWTLSISYQLNGVAVTAEELAGKTGVVEIAVDAIPNENASEYARFNYTLEAMALFNQDNILSLEAPGAQLQLVGNLRCVLFLALPGEEGHFVIRVGTDSFSFDGMTFMMVPATLGQLSEVAKLGERKEELEEDYDQLSGSLDALLDSLTELSGSLRAAAGGLDELEGARKAISEGKGEVKAAGDKALGDLEALAAVLELFPGHLESGEGTVTDLADALTRLTDSAAETETQLDEIVTCLEALEKDLKLLASGSGDVEDALDELTDDLARLKVLTRELNQSIETPDVQVNGGILEHIDPNLRKNIKVSGKSLDEVWTGLETMEALWPVTSPNADGNTDFTGFETAVITASVKKAAPTLTGAALTAAVTSQMTSMGTAVSAVEAQVGAAITASGGALTQEQALQRVLTAMKSSGDPTQMAAASAYEKYLLMKQVFAAATDGGTAMNKVQFFTAMQMMNEIDALAVQSPENIAGVLAEKESYQENSRLLLTVKEDHDVIDGKLVNSGKDVLEALAEVLKETGGLTDELSGVMGDLKQTVGGITKTSAAARILLDQVDKVLDEAQSMSDTVNAQVPELKSTLADTRKAVETLTSATRDTHSVLSEVRDLEEETGALLDEGTRKSLQGLSQTLRRTANSMDAVGDVREAKELIDGIITDTWEEYTGKINNMLCMDANAEAVSLTSGKNPAPTSIQILIRSQEIKAEEAPEETAAQGNKGESGSVWGRIVQMFRDLWNGFLGLFHG